MAKIKLTKMALRQEQKKLEQLQMYLPTLKLKKSLLQIEVNSTKAMIAKLFHELSLIEEEILSFSSLLVEQYEGNYLDYAEVLQVVKNYENIAGVEIPVFSRVAFRAKDYFLMDTPPWLDYSLEKVRGFISDKERINVEEEKKEPWNMNLMRYRFGSIFLKKC